jgi:hypothetical protein
MHSIKRYFGRRTQPGVPIQILRGKAGRWRPLHGSPLSIPAHGRLNQMNVANYTLGNQFLGFRKNTGTGALAPSLGSRARG